MALKGLLTLLSALSEPRGLHSCSMSRLTSCFEGQLALARQHPLLAMALRRSDLRLVAHLGAVLDWQRLLRRHFELRLQRHEAHTLRIGAALQQLPEGRQLFESFRRAWKECAEEGCMARFGCKELKELPEIDVSTPLSLSCADANTDEGSYILALMQSLVEKQNSFLKEARIGILGRNSVQKRHHQHVD